MRYLSFDLEATGLAENDLIIEFAMIPFDTDSKELEEDLAKRYLIKCPSFEELRPNLNKWVIDNNEELIEDAHKNGETIENFKVIFEEYLRSPEVRKYFGKDRIILFGKSVNGIDLPFMNRDFGWDWMGKFFSHRVQDLSCVAYAMVDQGIIPKACQSGSALMQHLEMGHVCHTALEDARNTAIMYLKLLEMKAK